MNDKPEEAFRLWQHRGDRPGLLRRFWQRWLYLYEQAWFRVLYWLVMATLLAFNLYWSYELYVQPNLVKAGLIAAVLVVFAVLIQHDIRRRHGKR